MKILNVTRETVTVKMASGETKMIPFAEFKAQYPTELKRWVEDEIDFRNDRRI